MSTALGSNSAALSPWRALSRSNVALLTTFRRDGTGVGTPVGIRIVGDKVYFTTWSTTGKVKRLANNPRVMLAPCTRRGRVTGDTLRGIAHRLSPEEAERAKATLLKRTVWGALWDRIYALRGRQPVMYSVSFADGASD